MSRRWATALLAVALVALVGGLGRRVLSKVWQREQLPAEYAGLTNPLEDDAQAVATGGALFRENCTSCHGEAADGHGPAARGLEPLPANFRSGDVLARHSDAYLYYRVTTGKPGTAMPSFSGALDPAARWALVAYLRTLERDGRRSAGAGAPAVAP